MNIEEYDKIDLHTNLTSNQIDEAIYFAKYYLKKKDVSENDMVKAYIVASLYRLNHLKYKAAQKSLDKAFYAAKSNENKAKCYYYNARLLKHIGKSKEAFSFIEKGLFLDLSDSLIVKRLLVNYAGILQNILGNYALSFTYYIEVNNLLRKNKQSDISFLINFSTVNIKLLNYSASETLLLEALEIAKIEEKHTHMIGIYCNLIITYYLSEQYQTGLEYADIALLKLKEADDTSIEYLYILRIKLLCLDKLNEPKQIRNTVALFLQKPIFKVLYHSDKLFYLFTRALLVLMINKYNFQNLKKILYNRLGENISSKSLIFQAVDGFKKINNIDYARVGLYLKYTHYQNKGKYKKAFKIIEKRSRILYKTTYTSNVSLLKQNEEVLKKRYYYQEKLNQEALLLQQNKDTKILKKSLHKIAHNLKQPARNLNTLANLWPDLKKEEEYDFLKMLTKYTSELQCMIDDILEIKELQ